MKRSTFLLAAVGVIALGLASSRALTFVSKASPSQSIPHAGLAAWVFTTDDVGELARYADAVVVGRLQRRYAGRVAYSANGEAALHFELNEFVLTEPQIKTDFHIGDKVTVERVRGGSFDGGDFANGMRYLLFLKKQPDTDFYFVVNDEARFFVAAGGRLNSAASGKVAARLRGRPLAEARSLIATLLQERQ